MLKLIITSLLCLLLTLYFGTRQASSLCFIAEQEAALQVQFSPYYFHQNRLPYADVTSIVQIQHPNRPELSTLKLSTPRMNLIYGFVDSSWADISAFESNINEVFNQQRSFSCRLHPTFWAFLLCATLSVLSLIVTIRALFRRSQNNI